MTPHRRTRFQLRRRIAGPVKSFAIRLGAWIESARIAGFSADPAKVLRRLRKSQRRDPMQWRRWFQANRRRQRQLTALRRMGGRIDPRLINLPRYAVR